MTAAVPTFRPDIQALRAVAILCVLLFHFDVPPVAGGFVGVDIFFVISGFLITGIIVSGHEGGRFRWSRFYAARLRRIVPALLVLCLTGVAAGGLLLDPQTYAAFARAVPAALGFYSNLSYAREIDYFGAAADRSWLLHTWSLSVEAQFYLTYPLALALLWRIWPDRRLVLIVLAIGAVVSLALAQAALWSTPAWQVRAFYLLPCRAWELLAGGMLWLLPWRPARRPRRFGLLLGGMLIAAAVIDVPGMGAAAWCSLAAVAGAVLIIACGSADSRWARAPGLQPLGRWSYSIYLWHWPVAVALRYLEADDLRGRAAGILLSILLGFLSCRLIERPFHVGIWRQSRIALAALIGATFATVALSLWVVRNDGFEGWRATHFTRAQQAMLIDYKDALQDWAMARLCGEVRDRGRKVCVLGRGTQPPRVLLIGDSHAAQLAPRLARYDHPVALSIMPGCPILPGVVPQIVRNCAAVNAAAYDQALRGDYAVVVIASAWERYLPPERNASGRFGRDLCFQQGTRCIVPRSDEEVERELQRAFARLAGLIRRIRATGARVVVIGQFPHGLPANPARLYALSYRTGQLVLPTLPDRSADSDRIVRTGLAAAVRAGGGILLDPRQHLCAQGRCVAMVGGRALYKDDNHLRASAVTDPALAFVDTAFALPR